MLLDLKKCRNMDRSRLRNAPKIISQEIDNHDVLGSVFWIVGQLLRMGLSSVGRTFHGFCNQGIARASNKEFGGLR